MKKPNLFLRKTFDSNLFFNINPSTIYSERNLKYINCGPRIQKNPIKKYYGLELKNTIYSSPRVCMENYNKFKHKYITEITKKLLPKIRFQFFPTQNNEYKNSRNYDYYSVKYQTNNTTSKNSTNIEIQTLDFNRIDNRKSRNFQKLKKINLKFPYAKPTISYLDDYFRKIHRKKIRSKS